MQTEFSYERAVGFRPVSAQCSLPVEQAAVRLLSRRGRYYVTAVRQGGTALLEKRSLRCSACGAAIPGTEPGSGISRAAIRQWASPQLSLFDPEGIPLELHTPLKLGASLRCPRCGVVGRVSQAQRRVWVLRQGRKVILRSQVAELEELLQPLWLQSQKVLAALPLYEELTFHLDRGRCYVRLMNTRGQWVAQRDVTDAPGSLAGGACAKLLEQDGLTRRLVRRNFEEIWGSRLPFQGRRLDLGAFVQMTCFQGYPREFYDSIPYDDSGEALERSFRSCRCLLRRANNIHRVLAASGLPDVKSVRRTLLREPGLLFYLQEAAQLYSLVGDSNHLCRLLQSEEVYRMLATFHDRPGVLLYLQDLAEYKGTARLVALMLESWRQLEGWAIDYATLHPRRRRQRLEQQRRTPLWLLRHRNRFAFSLPMQKPDPDIPDGTVKGYRFAWLRSRREYREAARQLENCLGDWSHSNAPVLGIYQGSRILAAVELQDKQVLQVRGYDNGDIGEDPALLAAFQAWLQRYDLADLSRGVSTEERKMFLNY